MNKRTTTFNLLHNVQRLSSATVWTPDRELVQVGDDTARFDHDPATGDALGLLVERAATNLLSNPLNFADTSTQWAGGGDFTITEVPSIIEGQGAWRHENLGSTLSRARLQLLGVLTDQPETAYFIVENVDAAVASLGLRDSMAAAWVSFWNFNWATGEITFSSGGAGTDRSAAALKLMDVGPNGGPVYLLAVTGTPTNPGNDRRVFFYPTGIAQNTQTAIIHAAQHVVGSEVSSLIYSPDGSQATRANDNYSVPINAFPFSPTTGAFEMRVTPRSLQAAQQNALIASDDADVFVGIDAAASAWIFRADTGVISVPFSAVPFTLGQTYEISAEISLAERRLTVNGETVTGSGTNWPASNAVLIGRTQAGAGRPNMHLQRLRWKP